MKVVKRALMMVIVVLVCAVMNGCTASSDAVARLELFPNTSAYGGKNANEVAIAEKKANLARTAMTEDVVKTPEDLNTTMTSMGF